MLQALGAAFYRGEFNLEAYSKVPANTPGRRRRMHTRLLANLETELQETRILV
jgi:hypothetical protein